MPTFLGAAGAGADDQPLHDGIDLLALLHGRCEPRESFIGAYGDQFGVLRDGWKYLYTTTSGAELLFDLNSDPMERRNLAPVPKCALKRNVLRQELIQALLVSGSSAVADNDLKMVSLAEEAQGRTRRWPGFHSRDTRTDVLH